MSRLPTLSLFMACLFAGFTIALNAISTAVVNLSRSNIIQAFNASFRDHYGYTPSESGMKLLWGTTVGIPFFIAVIVSMFVHQLAEMMGRKASLFYCNGVIIIIGAVLSAVSKPLNCFEIFVLARVIFGIYLGISVPLTSVYITECSPPHLRGMASSFIGTCSITVMSLSNVICLPQLLGTSDRWPYVFVIIIIACVIIIMVAYFFLPETPKYLYLHKKNREGAERAIRRLYGPHIDMNEILFHFEEEGKEASEGHVKFSDLWHIPHLRWGLLVGCCGALARAVCGVNLIYAFSTDMISKSFHISRLTAKYVSVAIMSPQIIACIITACIIDRIPRRKLFLSSLGVMICCNSLFVILCSINEYSEFHSAYLTYTAIAALMLSSWIFPFGVTPIGFILVTEVIPQAARSKAAAIAMGSLNGGVLIQLLLFPILNQHINAFVILILAVIPGSIFWLLLYCFMPETQGRTVEEIVKQWIKDNSRDSTESLSRSESDSLAELVPRCDQKY